MGRATRARDLLSPVQESSRCPSGWRTPSSPPPSSLGRARSPSPSSTGCSRPSARGCRTGRRSRRPTSLGASNARSATGHRSWRDHRHKMMWPRGRLAGTRYPVPRVYAADVRKIEGGRAAMTRLLCLCVARRARHEGCRSAASRSTRPCRAAWGISDASGHHRQRQGWHRQVHGQPRPGSGRAGPSGRAAGRRPVRPRHPPDDGPDPPAAAAVLVPVAGPRGRCGWNRSSGYTLTSMFAALLLFTGTLSPQWCRSCPVPLRAGDHACIPLNAHCWVIMTPWRY